MSMLDNIKSGIQSAVNVSGKFARGATDVLCKANELTAGCLGALTEAAGNVASKGVGLLNERLGESVHQMSLGAAKAVQIPSKSVSWALRQGVNAATCSISKVVGDGEGENDASMAMSDTNQTFLEHLSAAIDAFFEAERQLSGKAVYDEAKRLYVDIARKREQLQSQLDNERNALNALICKELDSIDVCRARSKAGFARFEKVALCVAEWRIQRYAVSEDFEPIGVKIPPMLTTAQIFKNVDFESDPITTRLKGYMTLGFLTAAQAEQAKVEVEELKKPLKEETDKARAENRRWEKTLEALHGIRINYEMFIGFYDRLVAELEYALAMLRQVRYCSNMDYFKEDDFKINVYYLPERHLRCLMACDKLSRIVCEMSKRKYLEVSNNDFAMKSADVRAFKENRAVFVKVQNQMAA